MLTGSVGARISELKQKVISENPRRYGLAVPRKCLHVYLHSVSPECSLSSHGGFEMVLNHC